MFCVPSHPSCLTQHRHTRGPAPRLRATFGDQRVSVRACDGAVNLADQLHVVEQGVEGVEVREAHHVGGAASCSLRGDTKMSLFKLRQKRIEVTNCTRISKNSFYKYMSR